MEADSDWRMSHEISAAGYGFIWPRLAFASDGEAIWVKCWQSSPLSSEPVRYLSDFEASISSREFEHEIDHFVDLVLRRLDGSGQTELQTLWRQVLAERADPEQSAARRIEARLGYEPDDAPVSLMQRLLELTTQAGPGATDEIAPVCAGSDPGAALREVLDLSLKPGVNGKISVDRNLRSHDGEMPPWQRGRQSARHLRRELGLLDGPITDDALAAILEIPRKHLECPSHESDNAPIGLAIRGDNLRDVKLLFRKRNRPARRFEAARFVADYLFADLREKWLPLTDAATARQKVQRAFAAEFLCPIESLRFRLGDEFLPEAFDEAADYFGISERAVRSHLANHGLIPRSLVDVETMT